MVKMSGPMNFSTSPEQDALVDIARRFGQQHLAPFYQQREREGAFDRPTLREMGRLGFFGVELPAAYGGLGRDCVTAGLVLEALSAADYNIGQLMVAVSLARTGAYTIGWDLNMALRLHVPIEPAQRYNFPNPLILPYRCADGHTLWLLLLQGDRHWPDFCRAIQHEEWMQDPRYLTIADRAANADPLVRAIAAVMAEKTAAEWSVIFDRENVWYAPVQTPQEVVADPVMAAAGAFVEVPMPDGAAKMVATPADFYGTPWRPRGPAPELGQHTEEVLLELGLDWDRIIALKEQGVIP